jgi:hypothetical protein
MIWKVQGGAAFPTASVAWQVRVPKSISVLALKVKTLRSPFVVNCDLRIRYFLVMEFPGNVLTISLFVYIFQKEETLI